MTEVPVITEAPDVSEDPGITEVNENKERVKYGKVNKRIRNSQRPKVKEIFAVFETWRNRTAGICRRMWTGSDYILMA